MKKIVSILLALAVMFCAGALCEAGQFDLSGMTEDELTALIEAAQDELEARRAADGPADAEAATEDPAEESTLYVSEARLLVQSEQYKSLYPDMLQAILVNGSDDDIKDAKVAFMAWDVNRLPVLLKGQFDYNQATYVRVVSFTGVNMVPGSTFGERNGMRLDESISGIETVKAIVVSYETFDGEKWTNPNCDAYVQQYAGKKLPED